jgi:predicted transcriptional regulator
MNEETLMQIGLTKGEANVYLRLLETGLTSTGKLIAKSTVSRSKVYDVLERLKKKGFVSEISKGGVRFFEGCDPNRIIDFLENKKNMIENKIKESKKIVDDLNRIRNLKLNKQEARVYSGLAGVNTIYNEILNELDENGEYLAFGIGSNEIQNEKAKLFIKKFHMRRAEKKINARVLMMIETKSHMKDFSDLKFYRG